jgi:3-dehydroquinate synthase
LGRRCALITDTHVARLYAKQAERSLRAAGFDCLRITVAAGEQAKRVSNLQACWDLLAAHRLERSSFVVALGGGVVGDLAGFVAATYLRGLAFVQVPTSLLAQVDSSVGGKVAVNLQAGKNLVGAFYQPRLVLCDLAALRSLPPREFRAGLAEVIKYGVISDPALFRRIERNISNLLGLDLELLATVVAQCCQIKAGVVGQDEQEAGLRAILNFGHTIGHAIENSAGYGRYLHGEAIAIGQVAAARLSRLLLGLPEAEETRLRRLLAAAGLPTGLRLTPAVKERLLRAMRVDKKVSGGRLRFVLARRIGQVEWGWEVPRDTLEQALQAVMAGSLSRRSAPARAGLQPSRCASRSGVVSAAPTQPRPARKPVLRRRPNRG